MSGTRVYDLPTRVFHWLFAILFITAFTITQTIDDDSGVFSYHMLAGIVLTFAVLGRLIWGFFGTQHATFGDLKLRPQALIEYVKRVISSKNQQWPGHNPASSWAAVLMILIALGLAITGYLMITTDGGKQLKEVHELLANGFLIVVLIHIAGVIVHTMKYKDPIAKSMIHGRKSNLSEEVKSVNSHRPVAVVYFLLVLCFAGYVLNNFNSEKRELVLFGTQFNMQEARHQHDGEHHESHDN